LSTSRSFQILPTTRDLPALATLLVAYVAPAVWSLQYAVTPGAGAAFWPAAGVAFAALVLGGVRLWPAIFIGRVIAGAIAGGALSPMALAFAGAATLGAVLPMLMIGARRPIDPRLNSLTDMARLVVLAAFAGAFISALFALPALLITGGSLAHGLDGALAWGFGYVAGVLVIAPTILVWSVRESWQAPAREWAHLAACLTGVAAVAFVAFYSGVSQTTIRTWHIFPMLVWAALAFNARGASLALLISTGLAVASALTGMGAMGRAAHDGAARLQLAQQFVVSSAVTILILAAVADERRGRAKLARSETQLRAETEALETLNRIGEQIASQLDVDRLVRKVTDAGVALTGAKFGAFFYNVLNEQGESYQLYALSGAPRAAFDSLGMPRNTAVFGRTFSGQGVLRSADITKDPRYGQNGPHKGMPTGHLPVRSYLATPVKLRSGEVVGGLFFGHPEADVFDERAERLAVGLAAQAAVALDNARLFQAAQTEIAERTRAEEHQRLLVHELNHRVKNTLATVQSIAAQTSRSRDLRAGYASFTDRLMALSRAHDVLTRQSWEGADLMAMAQGAVLPFETDAGERFHLEGPHVWLGPQQALAIAMALHELATNAAKYGALSLPEGQVDLTWEVPAGGGLTMTWRERGGPPVTAPTHRGFGSRLLERGLAAELAGTVTVDYRPAGLVCVIKAGPAADMPTGRVMEL
jgi:two-component sensor histidine kinase/integral membrane sensor domain MASE1